MKYASRLYARALSELIHARMSEKEKSALVKNFVEAVKRHGDGEHLKHIVAEAERMIREHQSIRKVTIETARPQKFDANKLFAKFLEKTDVIEMKVRRDLVAGIKITINDERELDMTLRRKLNKLFAAQ